MRKAPSKTYGGTREKKLGKNHPRKHKIVRQPGKTPKARAAFVQEHYENVKVPGGAKFWEGIPGYKPETDPFYRSVVTTWNNR